MTEPSVSTPLLEVRHITKRYPGVVALDRVDLTFGRGEVLAVIGENGAGKSTLMKLLAGVERPDDGEIRLDGRPLQIDSVQTALSAGISLIHQELNLADNLSVAANIFLGREPLRHGLIDRRRIDQEAGQYLKMVGLNESPRTIVSRLPIGRQQMVEIAKALSTKARILIMDEPTSSLSRREADALFHVIGELRNSGVSIIYISHRLGEVRRLADRVTVLRDGRNAGDLPREEIDHERMVKLMVGRDVSQFYQRHPHQPGEVVLEADRLVVPDHPKHEIGFALRRGEIVGIAGLVGAGRSELLEVLFGVRRPLAGELKIAGQAVELHSPQDAIDAGVALVPEDRKQQGLILEMTVRENIGLPGLRRHRRAAGFRNGPREQHDTREMIERMAIRTPHAEQTVQFLSGGNQQKVVLGKWLALAPRVLLLDEPTRGIDVGAKQEIYHLMDRLAGSGVAILYVSSEMEEILGMADRVLVMHEGAITGQLGRDQLTEESVMRLATGQTAAA